VVRVKFDVLSDAFVLILRNASPRKQIAARAAVAAAPSHLASEPDVGVSFQKFNSARINSVVLFVAANRCQPWFPDAFLWRLR
jgi:hypothetical protein